MDYVSEAMLPQGAAVGTRHHHKILPTRIDFLAFAADEGASRSLLARAIGPHIGPRGSFAFGFDEIHQHFRQTEARRQGPMQPAVEVLLDVPKHLGSISMTGALLGFREGRLSSFWIEAAEAGKTRILTGVLQGERFFPLPNEWEFQPALIAREIYSLF